MSVIAFVQSYPYDAVAGGDGAYIQSLGQYLISVGHEVHGFVSDTIRGRSNPIYRSAYPVELYRSWTVRGAIRIGPRTFLTVRAAQVSAALARLRDLAGIRRAGRQAGNESWILDEAAWVLSKLRANPPGVVVLCFDAIQFAPLLRRTGAALFSLPGSPMFRRGMQKGEQSVLGRECGQGSAVPSEQHLRIAAALRAADRVGLASHDDVGYTRGCLGVNQGMLVGMGFPRRAASPDSDEPVVLFVGNMTPSNQEGLAWFQRQVWPRVRAGFPLARFRVVGRAAAALRWADDAAIELIGPVEDLGPEYARAQVVIAPLVSGTTGVKVKVAEAMGYGRPLVTTTVGVDPGDKEQLDPGAIVADNPEEFAAAILALLREPSLRSRKSRGAMQVFEKCFSYEACYRDVASWIASISKERPDLGG